MRPHLPQKALNSFATGSYADGHIAYIQAKESIDAAQSAWKEFWQNFYKQYHSSLFIQGRDRLRLQVGTHNKEHDYLYTICERARHSKDYSEWWERLTLSHHELVKKIKPILISDTQGDEELHTFFSHVDIEIWTLEHVERDLVPTWMPLSDRPFLTLFRLLRDRVGGEARVRGTFYADALRRSLMLDDELHVVAPPSVDEIQDAVRGCGALLRQQKHTIGHTGYHITRPVVDQLLTWIREAQNDQNVAVLLDQAGSGKTVVIRDVLLALEKQGLTVLGVKADQQLSGLVRYEDLPSLLHLPDTVERTVLRLAEANPVCILIDQIDALSLSLARDQTALNLILEMVARLRMFPNVRVLLTCRTFDFNSDPRLKRTGIGQKFYLTEFTAEEVRNVLSELGFAYDSLSPATQTLLRIPLHLDLFAMAVAEHFINPQALHALSSLQDLYSLLWQNIILKTELSAPSVAEREQVLRRLTEEMNRHQQTSAPQSLFTTPEACHLEPAARWLASAGILISTKSEWLFLHQTFFDYCYAKYFVERGDFLTQTLFQGEQGLFARPQIIQILTYLRGINSRLYLNEFHKLLINSNLRFHLHDLLIRWFGSLLNPTDEERIIAQRMLADPALRPRVLQSFQGNGSWFDRMSVNSIRALLDMDDSVLDNEVIPYLASLLNVRQAEVINLVSGHLGHNTQWDRRLFWMLQRIGTFWTSEAIALLERVLRTAPTLDPHQIHDLEDISKQDPQAVCRLLRLVFDRLLDGFLHNRETSKVKYPPSLPQSLENLNGSALENVFGIVCEAKAGSFLESMMPWLERILRLTDVPTSESLFFSADDLSHGWYDHVYVIQHELIQSFTKSLIAIASSAPDAFRQVANRLANLPFQTSQQLLARVYAAVADRYPGEALAFLRGDQRRLNLGDHEQYETRQLITALSPYLSDAQRDDLEATILAYAPIWRYGGTEGLRWRGLEQLYLFQAIPAVLLKEQGYHRLRELKRKFPNVEPSTRPIGIRSGTVGAPLPAEAIEKMSDNNWLKAMRKYRGRTEHKDFLKGGAYQLGHVLAGQVKVKPQRFWQLFQQVPDDLDDNYVQAFLNGFSEADSPAEWLFEAVSRYAYQPGRDLRRTIAWTLEKRSSEGLPEDLMRLLESYCHDTALDTEQNSDPDSGYLNSDRGGAFRTIMRTLDAQNTVEALQERWRWIEYAATDTSTSLRAGAVEELLYLLGEDRERAIGLFEQILDNHPTLLSSQRSQEFIYYGLSDHFGRLAPVIQSMMDHADPKVQKRGAELACIAAISPPVQQEHQNQVLAQSMAEAAITGPPEWRRGAAHVYTQNLNGSALTRCAIELIRLVDDEDDEVRGSIRHRFHFLQEQHFFSLKPFLEAFAASRSLGNDRHQFAEFMWEHGLLDPAWSLSIVEMVLNNPYISDNRLYYADGEALIRLVVRINTDPTADDAIRLRAMNLFDGLMGHYQGDAQRILDEWDRR